MKPRVTFESVRKTALALPGAEEGTSYGTPAFRAGGKLFARFNPGEGAIVVRVDMDEREALMEANPETFFITDHYRAYPAMLVRVATATPDEMRDRLEASFRRVAPKKLLAALDARRPS
jgi:hypothetical protein